jgi:hypothetical protein
MAPEARELLGTREPRGRLVGLQPEKERESEHLRKS